MFRNFATCGRAVLIIWFVATLLLSISTASAQKPLLLDTPVVVAEEVTQASDCRRSVDGGTETACPPGSVFIVRETVYRDVISSGIRHWIVKTENIWRDEEMVLRAARSEFESRTTATSCTYGTRDIYQSYLYVPNVPNSTRIGFNLKYKRNSDCSVTEIYDRNRVQSIGSSGDAGYNPSNVYWLDSCIGASCAWRGFYFGTSWTYLLSVPDSTIGATYRNRSYAQPECQINGVRCGNPYGYYVLD